MPKLTRDILSILPHLQRYALVLSGDDGQAEDLLQETFLRAQEGRATFDRRRPVKLWMMSILHNAFVDAHRSKVSREKREASYAALQNTFIDAPQEAAVHLAQVKAAFFDLPPDQREALHLIAVEGMSYAEAAALLRIPQGTLMTRVSRARAALRAFQRGKQPVLRIIGGEHVD